MVLKAALENDDVFDSDLFQRALLKSYITDESILHLENRNALMAYAKHHSRKLLMQDKTTGVFHETPKNMKVACNGSDKEKWLSSMQREMDAMEKKEVWEETDNLPLGSIPLPLSLIHI